MGFFKLNADQIEDAVDILNESCEKIDCISGEIRDLNQFEDSQKYYYIEDINRSIIKIERKIKNIRSSSHGKN